MLDSKQVLMEPLVPNLKRKLKQNDEDFLNFTYTKMFRLRGWIMGVDNKTTS